MGDTIKHRKNRKTSQDPLADDLLRRCSPLLTAAVVGSYLIAPGVWQWNRAAARAQARTAITQIDVEPGPVDPQLVAAVARRPPPVPAVRADHHHLPRHRLQQVQVHGDAAGLRHCRCG